MKKYPSYTTITNPANPKKQQVIPKYERTSPTITLSNINPNPNTNTNPNMNNNTNTNMNRHVPSSNTLYINQKKQIGYIQKDNWGNSHGNTSRKYFENQITKKQDKSIKNINNNNKIMPKLKTQTNQNYQNGSRNNNSNIFHAEQNKKTDNKQEYQVLKSRLNALQDRLVEIKKSYQMRKNKHFSVQKQKVSSRFNGSHANNKENQKVLPLQKRQLNIQTKPTIAYSRQIEQRLQVQSPKSEIAPSQIQKNSRKLSNQPSKQQSQTQITPTSSSSPSPSPSSSQSAIIHQYVTQYQQKPTTFKHTASQTNLFRPLNLNNAKQPQQNKNSYQNIYYVSALIRAMQTSTPSTFDQLCAGHLLASYQFLCYVKNAKIQKPIKPVIRSLPPPIKKQTIIFDLDQTLIHCLDSKKSQHADVMIPVLFPDKNKVTVGINIRPYTRECLRELSKHFQLIIFTASHANYATAIIEHLDPQKQFISHKFSRESCYKTTQGFYVKDLRVIDRRPENMLLIDNAAYSYCFQPQNGIPIVPYYDNKADLQLKNLIPYLKGFIGENDVRERNSQIMRIGQYTKYKGPEDIINKLYK